MHLVMSHPEWVIGFEDETWWSRLAQPNLFAWKENAEALRLHEKSLEKEDSDPIALACYGLLVRSYPQPDSCHEEIWLRFVKNNPISGISTQFLQWCCEKLEQQGKTALFLIWDNASWHKSYEVKHWIENHNQTLKREKKGIRILVSPLPVKSPWLNPIEPKWAHGKRRLVEPDRVLSPQELMTRVYQAFNCPVEKELSIPEKHQ